MEITLQYLDDCPNWRTTADRLQRLVEEEHLDATVSLELVDSVETAATRDFRGSPTVLIDGIDPFPTGEGGSGMACRVYLTDEGWAGSPSLAQLRRAINVAGS